MILASNPDRAVTVRERDPTYPGNDVPGGPRGALVDEVNGDSICDQIPLPHGHGSVNFRFSMIPSSLKFQVSGSPSGAGPIRKGNFPSHGSLKRKRGVGERHKSSRLGACLHFRLLHPRISLHSNPSLALQASCTLPRAEEVANHRVKFQVRHGRERRRRVRSPGPQI